MKIVQILPENINIEDVIKLHTNLQIGTKEHNVETMFKVK